MALTGRLVATSSFTGSAVILISDAVTQGYASVSTGQSLRGITVDATAITSGTVDGVRVFGQVQGPVFERVSVYGVSGNAGTGFNFARDTSVGTGPVAPWSIRCRHCYAYGFGGGGFFTYNATDSAFDDCEAQAIGGGNPGWLIQGGGNTTWKGCRAENNGGSGNGFVFTQTAGGTNPTGLVEGCITNLNGGAGFLVQHAGYSLTFTGCKAEGDTAAGFDIENADGLVTLAGCSVPAASAGPVNGLLVKNSAALLVIGGSYYGSTAGVGNGGGNSNCYFGPDMAALSGSSSSPALAALPNIDLWAGSDMGYIAQAFDRVGGNTASQGVTSGTPFLIGLRVRAPAPAAGVQMRLAVNGAGLTASQNFVALYSFAGALLGSSADQSGVWNTGAPKDLAMTLTQQSAGSLNLAPGNYWVMVLSNGTTPPLFTTTGATTQSTAVANGKLGVAVARFATCSARTPSGRRSTDGLFHAGAG